MRLPQPILDSNFFVFETETDLITALLSEITGDEVEEIWRLSTLSLPPITSIEALATMLGISPGLIWSLQNRQARHYKIFEIAKGTKIRVIHAPRIALKVIQKWLSVRLQDFYRAPDHVFGFVADRSHIDAASVHCNAEWIYSVDIKDFFPTTPAAYVESELVRVGYNVNSAQLISSLLCRNGFLPQGAPSSPLLSNMAFRVLDKQLEQIAGSYQVRLTRYADDIVFSGRDAFPSELPGKMDAIFSESPWELSQKKTEFLKLPQRLKVHGLLVHGDRVRLTKGYRNKIRAYSHLLRNNKVRQNDINRVHGHVTYSKQVSEHRPEDRSSKGDLEAFWEGLE